MIDKEAILSKIDDLLKELTQRLEYINDEDPINPLEYELFEVNAIYFAEHAKILRKLLSVSELEGGQVNNNDVEESSAKEAAVEEIELTNTVEESDHQRSDEELSGAIEDTPIKFESLEDSASTVEEGESSFNSVEKGSGIFESELVVEADEVIGEEDEVVLEKERFEDSTGSRPEIRTEKDSSLESQSSLTEEIVIEEREFAFKVETEKVEPESKDEKEIVEKPVESISLSQTYSTSKPESLNDRISALRQSQSPASGNNVNPNNLQRVGDIKSIINLNDKLLFIKDLFNGYSLAYSEAIELLNRYESFADADQFLQNNYAEKNNWASKKDTVEKLYAILRKRYG